jgi:hypothetical protein
MFALDRLVHSCFETKGAAIHDAIILHVEAEHNQLLSIKELKHALVIHTYARTRFVRLFFCLSVCFLEAPRLFIAYA